MTMQRGRSNPDHSRHRRPCSALCPCLALKAEIPHAQLLTLSGTGHELHPDDWSVIIEAIQQHTAL